MYYIYNTLFYRQLVYFTRFTACSGDTKKGPTSEKKSRKSTYKIIAKKCP